MANLSSIARPYALAAFEYARDNEVLPAWKNFLEAAAYMAQEASVNRILANPALNQQKAFEFFDGVLHSIVDSAQKNFLLLLAQHKRLLALPEIAVLFLAHFAALEKIARVRIVTASTIEDDFRQKLVRALQTRIAHDVTLQCEVDPAIVGGAMIYMGDKVIDGSIRGKLTRLLESFLR